ncbi:tyrosine-type recombinase/integrase [Microvirga sp. 2MCAF38]
MNPVADVKMRVSRRGKARPEIPTKDELRAIISAAAGRWRPLIITAIFTGLRASEIRGLRWADVDLKRGVLTVSQRADAWKQIGAPKSEADTRDVPWPPSWSTRCGNGSWLAPRVSWISFFRMGQGTSSISQHHQPRLGPDAVRGRCGDPRGRRGQGGEPAQGSQAEIQLHSLRHAAASMFIESA